MRPRLRLQPVRRKADCAPLPAALQKQQIGPSYLSAKAFAEAIVEMLGTDGALSKIENLPELKKRVESLVRQTGDDLLALKAGLEGWFDEAMQRLAGAYKKWATVILFLVGLGLAGVMNASATNVAHDLWQDAVTRQVVAGSAAKLVAAETNSASRGVKANGAQNPFSTVAEQTDRLQEVALPVGWGEGRWTHWWENIPGWLLTALLVMLGGPFWFDLLSRLVALRVTGPKPEAAVNDASSATGQLTGAASTASTTSQASQAQRPVPKGALKLTLTSILGSVTAEEKVT